MRERIAVLGCGPAGLLAAHAASLVTGDPDLVDVFSLYRPSPIGGAQYLHRAIPGLTKVAPDGIVTFKHLGIQANYAMRVYGNPEARTSWGEYAVGQHPVWNMRRAYAALWAMYESRIKDHRVSADDVAALGRSYPHILSTIPLKAICRGHHTFTSQAVWITSEEQCGDNEIIYNGTPLFEHPSGKSWYRASKIFGVSGAEYGEERPDAVKIEKPLWNDCTCHPDVTMLGRYGSWTKSVLIHHAFEGALKALNA